MKEMRENKAAVGYRGMTKHLLAWLRGVWVAAILVALLVACAERPETPASAMLAERPETPASTMLAERLVPGPQLPAEVVADFEQAVDNANSGHRGAAVALITRVLEFGGLSQQNRALVLSNRGTIYFQIDDYDRAAADFDQSLALQPDEASRHNLRGLVYERLGHLDLAIADYTVAIGLEPGYAHAIGNRGIAQLKKGLYTEAIRDLDRVIELEPNFARWHLERGRAHFNRGKARFNLFEFYRAEDDFDRAIELDPDYAQAYFYRAHVYERRGMWDRASADYRTAQRLRIKLSGQE